MSYFQTHLFIRRIVLVGTLLAECAIFFRAVWDNLAWEPT